MPRRHQDPRVPAVLALLLLAGACTDDSAPPASPSSPPGTASASAAASTPPTAATPAVPSTPAAAAVPWPEGTRGPAPAALGAVQTTRIARTSAGTTLAARLVLPRVGGTVAAPLVLTPCGRKVTLRGGDVELIRPSAGGPLPKKAADVVVVIDPGHGGSAAGARGPGGTLEKTRVLEIAREVRTSLQGRAGRVVLTRDRDMDATLPFRAALVDALRADVSVSVHLNAEPDLTRATPGLETYASIAEPQGRRLAGVLYESQRRYLDTLGGPWAADRDAGAKYRVGRDGQDYYGLLRRAHRPFAISESLFISAAREEELVARSDVRAGLGRAIADGLVAFTQTAAAGSGWTRPYPRPADPGAGQAPPCVDPAR